MPCETKRNASDLVLATPDPATFGLLDGAVTLVGCWFLAGTVLLAVG
jgi:hypothetical protein